LICLKRRGGIFKAAWSRHWRGLHKTVTKWGMYRLARSVYKTHSRQR